MEEGSFQCLTVAVGNEIIDDSVDETLRTGSIGNDSTLESLGGRAVEVQGDDADHKRPVRRSAAAPFRMEKPN